MRKVLLAVLLTCICNLSADQPATQSPKLLLSPKLLRRLKRDRDRQTPRWVAFENRVKNVPDSTERGFELALYYAVTSEDARAQEAVVWAAAHPCERRQRALIQDWVGSIPKTPCPASKSLRDQAFEAVADGADVTALAQTTQKDFVPQWAASGLSGAQDLYSVIELLTVLRANGGSDIRLAASQYFRNLPVQFLLSLTPQNVEKPDWITHIAALALVSVDPNLESSQFLQGWAMEDRQTLKDGPGVAYELLWADPYLPGIAYQNLDPWIYDDLGSRLYARSNWTINACWINLSKAGVKSLNCPPGWQDHSAEFGSMTLVPMLPKCIEVAHHEGHQTLVLWKMTPGEEVIYRDKKEITVQADASGMWHPGTNVEGRVCRR